MLRSSRSRRSLALAAAAFAFAASVAVRAQEFGLGRTPTAEEVRRLDISIPPSGEGLPQASGTVERGKTVYDTQCLRCHGATGREGPQEALVGGRGSLVTAKPLKTVGSYWPYATTLWDYVNRAMPFDRPGTLPADDVYAVVAYVLRLNDLIGDGEVMDHTTLPKVRMPNRDGFFPDDRPDAGKPPGRAERPPGGARR
jgi:S-disulfanyl-L-cysteine oxidoreductase SoxD